MKKIIIDLVGVIFGNWIVLSKSNKHAFRNYWTCECQCENKKIKDIRQDNLLSNRSKSCGCLSIKEKQNRDRSYEKNIIDKKNYCEQCGKNNCKIINSKKYLKSLCVKHYKQLCEYGKFLDNHIRNQRDKNEIIEYDNFAVLFLYDKNNNYKKYALIDKEDISLISRHKWSLDKNNYVGTIISDNQKIYLHRLIMNPDNNELIDHKNLNTLDNRKNNLRICNKQQNQCNQKNHKKTKSGIKGVFWNKRDNKWYAEIRHNNKKIWLGSSYNIEEMIQLRKQAEIKYQGEFRYKGEKNNENFPELPSS